MATAACRCAIGTPTSPGAATTPRSVEPSPPPACDSCGMAVDASVDREVVGRARGAGPPASSIPLFLASAALLI